MINDSFNAFNFVEFFIRQSANLCWSDLVAGETYKTYKNLELEYLERMMQKLTLTQISA